MTTAQAVPQMEKEAKKMPPLFIDGYLTQLFEAGREPDYGYPKNGLPNTTGGDMEIVTGFLSVSPSDSQE